MLIKPVAPGTRVGAILRATADTVELLGFGVYEGDFRPPWLPSFEELWADPKVSKAGMTESEARLVFYENSPLFKNPRIKLDDRSVVWGCECWWGEEEKIKRSLKDREIVKVRILRNENGKPIDVEREVTE